MIEIKYLTFKSYKCKINKTTDVRFGREDTDEEVEDIEGDRSGAAVRRNVSGAGGTAV